MRTAAKQGFGSDPGGQRDAAVQEKVFDLSGEVERSVLEKIRAQMVARCERLTEKLVDMKKPARARAVRLFLLGLSRDHE